LRGEAALRIGIHINIMLSGAVLLAAPAARGDMSEPAAWASLARSGQVVSSPSGGFCELSDNPRDTSLCDLSSGVLVEETTRLAPDNERSSRRGSAKLAARELPASPGSAALFLSAIISAGAWHLVRSARQINLGYVPDWYHTGGPVQIARAVPLDLDFGTVPLCVFAQPVSGPSDFHRGPSVLRARLKVQYVPLTSPIRGPPVRCAL